MDIIEFPVVHGCGHREVFYLSATDPWRPKPDKRCADCARKARALSPTKFMAPKFEYD